MGSPTTTQRKQKRVYPEHSRKLIADRDTVMSTTIALRMTQAESDAVRAAAAAAQLSVGAYLRRRLAAAPDSVTA